MLASTCTQCAYSVLHTHTHTHILYHRIHEHTHLRLHVHLVEVNKSIVLGVGIIGAQGFIEVTKIMSGYANTVHRL